MVLLDDVGLLDLEDRLPLLPLDEEGAADDGSGGDQSGANGDLLEVHRGGGVDDLRNIGGVHYNFLS